VTRSPGSFAVDGRPLRIPAFRRLWVASAVSAVGGSFGAIAVPTQLFTLTGSSAAIGVSAVVAFVAVTVAALGGGALADVVDRRRLLLAAQAVQGGTCLLLWAQSAVALRSVPVLLVLVGAQGLGLGTVLTTTGAVVPRIVPVELLAAATGLGALVRYSGAVAGPLLAGVLIPVTGLGTLYLLDAVALLAVLWAVFRLPPMPPRVAAAGRQRSPGRAASARGLARGVGAGFGYLFADRLLLAVLGIDLAATVFGMPFALFPELARRAFGGPDGGGTALGLLYAAYPAGVLAMGLVSGTFTRARRHGALLVSAGAAWGLSVVWLGLAPGLGTALGALVLGGAVNVVLSTSRNAITMAHTDDALRGRTQGALTIVLVGGPQAGMLLHAAASSGLGPRPAVVLGGLLTVAAAGAVTWRVPDLWRYLAPPAGTRVR